MLNRTLINSAANAVSSNTTTIGPFNVGGSIATCTIENAAGGSALATFSLQGKATAADGSYSTLVSGTNWTTVSGTANALVMFTTTTNVAALPSGGTAVVMVDVGGFELMQFSASAAGTGTASVNVNMVFTESS
jgi:hypothetical protein